MSNDLNNVFDLDSIEIDETVLDKIASDLLSDHTFVLELQKRVIPTEIVRDNLAYFIDFYDTITHCPTCVDKNNCPLRNKHTPTDLSYLDGNLVRLMGLCPLIINENTFRSHYVVSDFPENYFDARLEDINVTKARARYIKALLKINDGSKDWLYVYGADGRGKLFMAVSLINTLIDHHPDIKVGVLDYPKFIKEKTLNYFDNKVEIDRAVTELSKVNYLIIKDFGNEEINSLVVEGITLPLIQQLSRNGAVIIFVSNLSMHDLKLIYESKPKTEVLNRLILNYLDDNVGEEIKLSGMRL